jgi:hypothetical protein
VQSESAGLLAQNTGKKYQKRYKNRKRFPFVVSSAQMHLLTEVYLQTHLPR